MNRVPPFAIILSLNITYHKGREVHEATVSNIFPLSALPFGYNDVPLKF
jgi:hypothetical protein